MLQRGNDGDSSDGDWIGSDGDGNEDGSPDPEDDVSGDDIDGDVESDGGANGESDDGDKLELLFSPESLLSGPGRSTNGGGESESNG